MPLDQLRWREFLAVLGGAAAAWPLAGRAQQPAVPVVGYLSSGQSHSATNKLGVAAFREALRHAGFVDGRNVAIDYRWADAHYDRLPGMAADLVHHRVDAIVTLGAAPGVLAAKAATTTIPILFGIGGDPVRLGLVANLRRPGGNLTGTTNLNTEILPKRLELLHELVPAADTIALLVNPTNPAAEGQMKDVQAAARALGRPISILRTSDENDLNSVFTSLTRSGAAYDGAAPPRSSVMPGFRFKMATSYRRKNARELNLRAASFDQNHRDMHLWASVTFTLRGALQGRLPCR